MQHNATSPAAVSYAQALLDLAADQSDAIGADLQALADAVQQDALLKSFLVDPAIAPAQRWQALSKALGGQFPKLLMNFLGVVNEKKRFALLEQIALAYGQLLDKKKGRVRVEATLAKAMSDEEFKDVQQRISRGLNAEAIVEQKVDESIIGGLVLRMQGKIVDGSVRAQIEAMRKQLLSVRPAAQTK